VYAHHPNIVTVHDFGQANGFFYLLMEFVEGVNLRQAMAAAPFTPEQALTIVPMICEALQYAHDEGVLHRDIKPENILLDTKGRVRLVDFGIAKLAAASRPRVGAGTEQLSDAALTKSGSALGTPKYMAPEQQASPETVDQRADIYSLGVVFYEMLTGELPVGPASQRDRNRDLHPKKFILLVIGCGTVLMRTVQPLRCGIGFGHGSRIPLPRSFCQSSGVSSSTVRQFGAQVVNR
jgi:serine/threonine protein kinase